MEMIWSVTGKGKFSTVYNLLALREESHDGQKSQDDANGAKIKGPVDDLESPDWRLIIFANNTCYWLSVQGTIVIFTVLSATDFCDFCEHVMMLPPPKLQEKSTVLLRPSPYVT